MKAKRPISLLLLIALAAILWTGAAVAEEPIILEIYTWNDQVPYVQAVIDAYQKEHDIEFNITSVPADGEVYDNKLTVMLSGNADMDIMGIKGTAQITQYRQTGSLLELTDMIKESDLDVSNYGAMFSNITEDGHYFALPMRSTCWVLYYNTEMFDAAGLEYPGQMTWPEYADLAKKLTQKDGLEQKWGGYWVSWPGVRNFFATQMASYLTDDDLSPLQANLEFFNQLYNVDQSHMGYAEMTSTESNWLAEFENGNAAMLPNGEWFVGSILQDEAAGISDVKWEIAPMPVPEGVAPGTTVGSMEFMAVNANSTKKEAAFDFLKYLCGEEGAAIYASMGLIPAYSSDGASAAFQAAVGKESASVFFEAKKVPSELVHPDYKEISNAFAENAELYLIGEKTIEETMENFIAQRESIVKK